MTTEGENPDPNAWLQEVGRAIEHSQASDAHFIEISAPEFNLKIKRQVGRRVFYPRETLPSAVESEDHLFAIIAPLTGVLYFSQTPDDPPFVKDGDFVREKQVVALIETMKIFNEVLADRSGKFTRRAEVEPGQLVQQGDAIMFIEQSDEVPEADHELKRY